MDLRVKVGADLENGPHSHPPSPTFPMKTAREKVTFKFKKAFSLMTALKVTSGNEVGFREDPRTLEAFPVGQIY